MAKRGNKEGSIYKRTDGRWCAQLTIGFQNGKQQKKYLYGKSRTEVRQKLLDFQSNKINLKQDKVEAFLLAWLRFLEPQIVESTFIGREHKIKAHIIPQIGHLKLNAVTVQHVSDMQLEINDNAGPTTAARCVKILRQAFKHAMISELLTKNVAELVPLVKADKKPIIPLTKEEITTWLEVTSSHWHYPLWYTAINTGLRRGELIALHWDDFLYTNDMCFLNVNKSVTRTKKGYVLGKPKTRTSTRHAPLAKAVVETLQNHKKKQHELAKAGIMQKTSLIFPNTVGKMQSPRNLSRTMEALQQKARMREFTMHDLRHTFASIQIRLGRNPKELADLMGHSKASFTLDTYVHLFEAQHKKEALSIEDILELI